MYALIPAENTEQLNLNYTVVSSTFATKYSNMTGTDGANLILEQTVFTVLEEAVAFSQEQLDEIASLSGQTFDTNEDVINYLNSYYT
jgi:hypothetical protein